MTLWTTSRSRSVPAVILVALGVFVCARAAPVEMVTAVRAVDLRMDRPFSATTMPPASAKVSKRPLAVPGIRPESPAMHGFYRVYLTPRMSALFSHEDTVRAAELAYPSENPLMPLTADPADVELMEKRAIRAVRGAFKRFAIERLGIDRWSLSGVRGGRRDGAPPDDNSRPVRFRLGFSSLAPRADLLIPVTAGRVVLSADARGHIRTTYEPTSSRLHFAADIDIPEHTATVRLNLQF